MRRGEVNITLEEKRERAMEMWIKNFLLEGGNIHSLLLIATVLSIGAITAIVYGIVLKRRFKVTWENVLDSLINELNTSGLEIANVLFSIAKISADVDAAVAIGMIKKEIEDNQNDPSFYTKLKSIIEGINDNNHTLVLNSDYANARHAIKEAISLIQRYSQSGNFESFSNFSIETYLAKQRISQAVSNLNGILYGLIPHEES